MNKKIIALFFTILLAFACNANPVEEYMISYRNALQSNNSEIVYEAIEKMEELQSEANIISHYFLVSKLYYALGEYDLAITAVEKDTSSLSEFYLSTLFYELGEIEKAESILFDLYSEYTLYIDTSEDDKLLGLYAYIFSIGIVLHNDFDDEIRQYLQTNRISSEDKESISSFIGKRRADILDSYWG